MPTDSALANIPCPICQEKFETSWNEKEQDFVWMDAKAVKGRIYHVSCYDALEKDGANASAARTATPDSVLGKRKAEVSIEFHELLSMANKISRLLAIHHLQRPEKKARIRATYSNVICAYVVLVIFWTSPFLSYTPDSVHMHLHEPAYPWRIK